MPITNNLISPQDLHPGNVLLGNDLHLRLTYQCEWVSVDKPVNWKAMEMVSSLSNNAGLRP